MAGRDNSALGANSVAGRAWQSSARRASPADRRVMPDPDGALNFLERYARGASEAVSDYVARNPTALHYLLVIFSYSRFLSETLVQQPELILWLHRTGPRENLERVKTLEDLHEEFARFEAVSLQQPPAVILARFKRREYLRIIYGPDYTLPENLDRLRSRGLAAKRSLALREFSLGVESLERFVRKEPLRRVHEYVFGVLALESEPVDPRL